MTTNHGKNAFLKPVDIFGVASSLGAQNVGCYSAPLLLQKLNLTHILSEQNLNVNWIKTILAEEVIAESEDKYMAIARICQQLADQVSHSVKKSHQFLTIGGDHSCAIGTWSGAATALAAEGDIGIIWIDAHMDAHTAKTTPSGAIHGMPVASLLGHGASTLTSIASAGAKIKAENICLIGVRSYEAAEFSLLQQLGVKVYFMDVIKQHGLNMIFNEAVAYVKQNTCAFGISLDMDALDPGDAPGVGSPVSDGIKAADLIKAFTDLDIDQNFLGFELAELNAFEDKNDKTSRLAIKLIQAIFKRMQNDDYY